MNDNAKCAGVGCSIREHCLRFTRPAVDNQQWIEPHWIGLPSGFWSYPAPTASMSCWDWLEVSPIPVEPHGGAQEEGDAC